MAEDTQIEPARRNRARFFAKWSAIVVGGLALLVAALLIGLNTGPANGSSRTRSARWSSRTGWKSMSGGSRVRSTAK